MQSSFQKGRHRPLHSIKFLILKIDMDGSDSPEAAERELGLFFADGEIQEWTRAIEGWVYDCSGDTPE